VGDEYKNSGQVGAMGDNAHSHDNTFYQYNFNNQPPSFTPPSLHQIKSPPRVFVGREEEMTELLQAFEKGGVNISGLSGVGKTALAYKLAEHLESSYPDAQFYLDLNGVSKQPLSPAEAMTRIIRSIHPEAKLPEDESSLQAIYLSELKGKKALLLLDNAASPEQIEPLIPPVTCGLLVTSRIHFTLDGLFSKKLDTLEPDDAQQLLLKIAPRIGDYAVKLAELCGYLPLALKVAASAVNKAVNLTPLVHIKRLEKRTKRLELVEASLTLSYDLLSIPMQKLWRSLAVFPNTFDDAAVAFLWKLKVEDAQDQLAELISYSLIEWNETTQRYRLHDLVRLFADAHLRGQERVVSKKMHAFYFCNLLAQTRELYLKGNEEMMRGLALFDLERENIEAGQAWTVPLIGKDEMVTQLTMLYYESGLYILDLRLHPSERIEWLRATLKAARLLKDRNGEGAALGNLGAAYGTSGETRKAIEFYEQALLIDREISDRSAESVVLRSLGLAFSNLGESLKAIEYYEQALMIAQEIGDRRNEGDALCHLGIAYKDLGDYGKALEFYEQALTITREIGDRRNEGDVLCNLGVVYWNLNETHKALEFYQQHLKITGEIGDLLGEGRALGNLGIAYANLGEPLKAIECFLQQLVITREIRDQKGEGIALCNIGSTYQDLGENYQAIEYYEQALTIAREIGDRRSEGIALWNFALTQYQLGDRTQAISFAEKALVIYEQIESPDRSIVHSFLENWKSEQTK
jgi:tetratricopeptide (TPR) repeat protein